jgi:hypothetical protein
MTKPRKRARNLWAPGMVYAVPLGDGSFGVAQAVDEMLTNVIYVALFSDRLDIVPRSPVYPQAASGIALVATWRQDLNRGEWAPLGVAPLAFEKAVFPNERFAASGYVGAKHQDAGLLAEFLAAFHGVVPWNVLFEEDYYDRLLIPGIRRPATAVILNPAAREEYRRTHDE